MISRLFILFFGGAQTSASGSQAATPTTYTYFYVAGQY